MGVAMTSNDLILLDALIEQKRQAIAPKRSPEQFFNTFVLTELLEEYDLTYEEIESGIIDGGGDGGIDAIYTFVGTELLTEDTSPVVRQGTSLELVVIQCKSTPSFSGTAIDKLVSTMGTLFNYERSLDDLASLYNEGLLQVANLFRDFHTRVVSYFPKLSVRFFYVSRGRHVHDSLYRQVDSLRTVCERLFFDASVSFTFVGARELLELARARRPETLQLRVADTPISTQKSGFVAIVELSAFNDFLTDSSRRPRKHIFGTNIRDYEGHNVVNRAIQDTLDNTADEDFWVLNNGITVLARKAYLAGMSLGLEDPQVVNGLQTSYEILQYFRRHPAKIDRRHVLVRVVIPASDASRDRIIVATNSQTPISRAVLRATDPFQQDIEQFLQNHGYFYERRRNEYKNEGRPVDSIVSMDYLARAVCAIALHEPFRSVKIGTSGRLLMQDEMYRLLFDPTYPLGLYLSCLRVMKQVGNWLATIEEPRPKNVLRSRLVFRWHLGMYVAAILTGKDKPSVADIANTDLSSIESTQLMICLNDVEETFHRHAQGMKTAYKLAKTPAVAKNLEKRAERRLAKSKAAE
jgi:hypothetical protein